MHYTNSPEETKNVALDLASKVKPGAILAFFGDLGTGKTTFIRYLAEHLSQVHPDSVSSPTFQYLNIYNGPITVYHFDLYRLKDSTDFIQMGFDDMLHAGGICCIEWAERIEDILPADAIRISITHANEGQRLIQI
ncbi:MAG: tRNA (adenosine(37)-N6)-threonylcarbamoyltransferase complex ATPase subunit type 1 TsaE [Verrucomicrobia bacterium]|nr:tRNA (adenosine(37)-N6)-threonylcarbamoyltransferase complex ATPase subunit type 1 TsaE [Verrucomicrobiota bacterium]MBS0636770.1 tRNA (adenosine(37)-N6)-threonylcarbamoyltransferase complex ATPase subunit type 1 TsaE [Verrucomicrobiota bacterium]